MIQRYFLIAIVSISISIISCRQDNGIQNQEDNNLSLLNKPKEEKDNIGNFAKNGDSTVISPNTTDPNDPPKNGTHWKIGDSITTDPPKNGTHWKLTDSLSTGGETDDPPKNGTHWKGKQ